jgi:rRNA processing/ribosome biogenesis
MTHINQVGPSWIQQLVSIIKPANAATPFFFEGCHALSRIVESAQEYPEVSRHVTAAAANLVTSLIDCVKANPAAAGPAMGCILSLQKDYFGAVGPVIRPLEKFVLDNMVGFYINMCRLYSSSIR